MNAERLLQHYEQIADAPDAIARLRRFILDLAVRGKLVPQDPADEPASELLKRIAAARTSAGIKVPPQILRTSDYPFPLPNGWLWSTIGSITVKTGSGSTPRGGKEVYVEEGIPFLRSQNIYNDGLRLGDVAFIAPEIHARMAGTAVKALDLLLNITGGSIGRCCLVLDPFGGANISQHVAIIRPALGQMGEFTHKLILSPYFQAFVVGEQTGAGRGGLPKNRMDQIAIPLPPLSEQHRIVAKVDELMALCDQLEAARTEREAKRDRLAVASLARLDNPNPETFRDDARFALGILPALTAWPDQIKQLRQTILNLAVRGKLVPQDPTDEPAVELLKKFSLGRVPRSTTVDPSFAVPEGWIWTTVQDVLSPKREISYGVIKLGDEPKSGGVPTLRCSDVRPGYIDLSGVRKVSEEIEREYVRTRLTGGEVLINVRGTLGGVALVPEKLSGFNVAREVAVVPVNQSLCSEFFVYLMLSPYFWEKVTSNIRGIAYKGLNLGTLREIQVPLPPLAEQRRVVARVDELMALCDQLETSLTGADEKRKKLLAALLAEALAPVDAAALQEAAE